MSYDDVFWGVMAGAMVAGCASLAWTFICANTRYWTRDEFEPWYDYFIEPHGKYAWRVLSRPKLKNNPLAFMARASEMREGLSSEKEAEKFICTRIRWAKEEWEDRRLVAERKGVTRRRKVPPYLHIEDTNK